MPPSDTDRWPWSIFGGCLQSHGAGPSLHERGVDYRSCGGGDVSLVGWPGHSSSSWTDLAVLRRILAGPPTALSFAGLSLVALVRA